MLSSLPLLAKNGRPPPEVDEPMLMGKCAGKKNDRRKGILGRLRQGTAMAENLSVAVKTRTKALNHSMLKSTQKRPCPSFHKSPTTWGPYSGRLLLETPNCGLHRSTQARVSLLISNFAVRAGAQKEFTYQYCTPASAQKSSSLQTLFHFIVLVATILLGLGQLVLAMRAE